MILLLTAVDSTLRIMIGRPSAIVGLAVSVATALFSPAAPSPTPPPIAPAPITQAQPSTSAPRPKSAPTELLDQRTSSSTTFRHPNGARTIVLSSGPIRIRQGTGWQPIDLTLRRDQKGIHPASAPYTLRLADGGTPADAASILSPDGTETALSWGAALPAPTLAGNRATYAGALPGSDLIVEATRSGFAAWLAPNTPVPTGLSAVSPLTLHMIKPGGAAEMLPQPEARPLLSGPVGTLANTAVTDRVVASAVTPTVRPFGTTVQNATPHSALWGDPDLRVGSYDGTTVARSYLSWDLGALHGQQITHAALRVFSSWSSSCQPQSWEVWSSQPVGPATRWDNQPAGERRWATSTATKGHDAGCAPGWINVDVTELVKAWVQAGATSGTVLLRATDETSPQGWKRFSSGEGMNVPALGVTVAPVNPTP